MNMKHWIGIDVSKEHLDVVLLDGEGTPLEGERIANERPAIGRLWKSWSQGHGMEASATLVCLEPTGHYHYKLLHWLLDAGLSTWLPNPLDIIQSGGMQRGKCDKVDALRIARYALRFQDKARLIGPDHLRMLKLRQLLSKRELLVRDKAKRAKQITDMNKYMEEGLRKVFDAMDRKLERALRQALERIDALIEEEIGKTPRTKQRYDLIRSVYGIGPVLAQHLLALTDDLTRFSTPRSLACHAGVAPFERTSGKSLNGKPRVSPRANKKLKMLLHLSAMRVIREQGELRDYYQRKVAEGKNRMLVLNNVRNKIVHRVFAVLQRGTPYQLKTDLQMS